MHCETAEEAREFCHYLHSIGRKWCNGQSYKGNTEWDVFKTNTAYEFNKGMFDGIDCYILADYTILEWSDFTTEFTKADLKNGDVVLRRNGTVEIVCVDLGALTSRNGYNYLSDIKEDLTSTTNIEWDIIAVRRPKEAGDCQFYAFHFEFGELVYERKAKPEPEPVEMTLDEVCKALGKEIKIVKE